MVKLQLLCRGKSGDRFLGRFSAKIEPLPFLYRHTPGGNNRGRLRGCSNRPRNRSERCSMS
jgi:hypothetical protein